MSVKIRKIGLGGVFLFCTLAGSVFAAFVEPAASALRELYQLNLHPDVNRALAPIEPWFSRVLIGFMFAGIGSFILWGGIVRRFAATILKNLVNLLRDRQLLPYKYKPPLKNMLDSQQNKIFSLMEHYVDTLSEVHKEKNKYKKAMDVYVDPMVAQGLARNKTSEILSSQRRDVAILFSDIRGFTAMSERLKPEQVVAVLNDYFMFSSEAVAANFGSVNKFIGDAVMAVFEERPHAGKGANAAENAINAALAMAERYHKMVPVWQNRIAAEISEGIGVGVTYGSAVMGNLGSSERMEYTAIGDTVNFSARLCGLAAEREVRVSQECLDRAEGIFLAEAQEPVGVKGKKGLFVTYKVISRKGNHF